MKGYRTPALTMCLAVLLAVGAIAQDINVAPGSEVTLNPSSEMTVNNVTNAGTINVTGGVLTLRQNGVLTNSGTFTQSGTSTVIVPFLTNTGTVSVGAGTLRINAVLTNNGNFSQDDLAITEFGGEICAIGGTGSTKLGKIRVLNSVSVGISGNVESFKVEILELGGVRVTQLGASPAQLRVTSTDDAEADPMVAVKPGASLVVEEGCKLLLGSGTLFVFSSATASGVLSLGDSGPGFGPAILDSLNVADPFSISMRGRLKLSNFKILHPSATGIEIKNIFGTLDPIVDLISNGTFDFPATSGVFVDFSQATLVKINDTSASRFTGLRFDNTGNSSGASNFKTSAATQFQSTTGPNISFVVIKDAVGALAGEDFDSEPTGSDLIRWTVPPPAEPTNLGQFKANGSIVIPVGGTTNDTVIFKGSVYSPAPVSMQIEVEVKPMGLDFDGNGTVVSGFVGNWSVASVMKTGLTLGNYHWRVRTKDQTGLVSGWVSFGSNSESETDFAVANINDPPADPTSLIQYRGDGLTQIPLGGNSNGPSVIFKGVVSDTDSPTLQLEVEVKPTGTAFDGIGTRYSNPVNIGALATVTLNDLALGGHHWRARTKDSEGQFSNWVSFGGNSENENDFVVNQGIAAPVITSQSRKTGATPLVTGTAVENATILVYSDGVQVAVAFTDFEGNWKTRTSSLSDGPHTITAVAIVGDSSSGSSNAIIYTVDTVPPEPPTNIRATAKNQSVILEWDASPSSDVHGYHIYRKLDNEPETAWAKLTATTGPVSAATRKYRDAGLTNGVKYCYKVTAVDDAQLDPESEEP